MSRLLTAKPRALLLETLKGAIRDERYRAAGVLSEPNTKSADPSLGPAFLLDLRDRSSARLSISLMETAMFSNTC